MERATLARPYAEAVGKLAAQSNTWDLWSQRLAMLAAVAADEQMLALALNPAVDGARVADVVLSVCGNQLGQEGANLVHLLSENKRLPLVPEIVSLFESLKAVQEGELNAHISTAYEMSAEQLASLVARLETKFGRKINAAQSVDADLIGGVIIQVGDEVMDASVRGGLESLGVTLKA